MGLKLQKVESPCIIHVYNLFKVNILRYEIEYVKDSK